MPLSRRICFTTLADDPPNPADEHRTDQSTDAVRETLGGRADRSGNTVRLALALFDSDEVSYPEFNYSQRVKQVPSVFPPLQSASVMIVNDTHRPLRDTFSFYSSRIVQNKKRKKCNKCFSPFFFQDNHNLELHCGFMAEKNKTKPIFFSPFQIYNVIDILK